VFAKPHKPMQSPSFAKETPCQHTKPVHHGLTTPQQKRRAATNTGLAKVAVQCSADTFLDNQCLVLRINICGDNRHLRQARER